MQPVHGGRRESPDGDKGKTMRLCAVVTLEIEFKGFEVSKDWHLESIESNASEGVLHNGFWC